MRSPVVYHRVRVVYAALALVGGLTLALALGASVLRSREFLPSESILAVAVGVAVGPMGLDLFPLDALGDPLPLVEQVALVTVALAVTSIALRLPASYFRRRAASMAALLGPGMLAMWLTSALAAYWILPVPFWVAMLVGAVVTPTDPVLANAIVVGETAENNVPKRLRYLLSGEAGANDGGAHPFVFLAILALAAPLDAALAEWVSRTVLLEVGGAVALGIVAGAVVGGVERRLSEAELMEETSVFTVTVALTFAVLGFAELLGLNGILAVFAAGFAYNWRADPEDEAREQRVEEVFNRLFTFPAFVLFGMVLPWAEWAALGWRGPLLVAAVLVFRRLPAVLALRPVVDPLDRPSAALFVGWFGPVGIAALYYAAVAARETGVEVVWPVVSLVVAGSILVHGGTSTLFTLRYGRLNDEGEWW